MEKWGYRRVSVDRRTQAAGWEEQHKVLSAHGCAKDRIYDEEASTRDERPVFNRMLADATRHYRKTGEKVAIVAAKLDRAFRDFSAADAAINDKHSPVVWLLPDVSANPLDPNEPGQMLLMRVMSAFAQFERDRLAERRAYGIALAKAEGKYKGRAPTARAKTGEVAKLHARGFRPDEIAKQLSIGRASVFRILKTLRETADHTTA